MAKVSDTHEVEKVTLLHASRMNGHYEFANGGPDHCEVWREGDSVFIKRPDGIIEETPIALVMRIVWRPKPAKAVEAKPAPLVVTPTGTSADGDAIQAAIDHQAALLAADDMAVSVKRRRRGK